jgi:hypothetical protein
MTTRIFAGFVVLFIGTPALAGPPSYNKLFQPNPL